ncbi:MAG: carbohydrate-binding family 9-like protein [Sedimentisphaeraceae bacterium JB056]
MKKMLFFVSAAVFITGCGIQLNSDVASERDVYKATYTAVPVKIDGDLNDFVWQQTPAYQLALAKDKAGNIPAEQGSVKFAWDDEYFYLAADFLDSDIVAQRQDDQQLHYRYGDLCELFLKPKEQTYYWELYVTPAGNKSSFLWPSRGYLGLPDCLEKYSCNLKVAAKNMGTLNMWRDVDTGWKAEMAMPINELEAYGYGFGVGQKWTILVSRYNYSRCLDPRERSMAPQLSKTYYHLYEEYAELELVSNLKR